MDDNIDRWNDRRLELEAKAMKELLTDREKQELSLVTRCVDYYIQKKDAWLPVEYAQEND